ncbi:MAG: hypothetical protein HXY39_11355, partial [Chloroflexi bacterium]|nr:hypothetical protein [Chloroflexota bacterium]
MTSPAFPELPADLQARLDAAGVTDAATLAAALDADPELRREYQAFLEANHDAIVAANRAILLDALPAIPDVQQLRALWQMIPSEDEDAFLAAAEARAAAAETSGDTGLAAALRERIDALRAYREEIAHDGALLRQALERLEAATTDGDLAAVWRDVPLELEETFLNLVAMQAEELEQYGDAELAAHVRACHERLSAIQQQQRTGAETMRRLLEQLAADVEALAAADNQGVADVWNRIPLELEEPFLRLAEQRARELEQTDAATAARLRERIAALSQAREARETARDVVRQALERLEAAPTDDDAWQVWLDLPGDLEEWFLRAITERIEEVERDDTDLAERLRAAHARMQAERNRRQERANRPVVQALRAFLDAPGDADATRVFNDYKEILQPFEAQRALDDLVQQAPDEQRAAIAARAALLRQLRGGDPAPRPMPVVSPTPQRDSASRTSASPPVPAVRYHEFLKAEPRSLARFIPRAVPPALRLPPEINRLDLLHQEGVEALLRELYTLLRDQGINYDVEPPDPAIAIRQQIRTIETILAEKRGTCLDLSLLFCAVCLAHDLVPLLIVLEGHVFAAVSTERTLQQPGGEGVLAFHQGMLTDLEQLKDQMGRLYLPVECTGFAASASLDRDRPEGRGRERRDGRMSFDRAVRAAEEYLDAHIVAADAIPGAAQRAFLYALDIVALQDQWGFTPAVIVNLPGDARSYLLSAHAEGGGDAIVVNHIYEAPPDREWLPPSPPDVRGVIPRADRVREVADGLETREGMVITAGALAVQGMAGIGKTVLARLVARECSATYTAGIFFHPLGETFRSADQAQEILRTWASHCYNGKLPRNVGFTPAGVRALLAEAIRLHGPLLIVLDDLWHMEAIEPLLEARPEGARLLVTTRSRWMADRLDIPFYELDVLNDAEVRDLFSLRLGTRFAALGAPPWMATLAEKVGRHALALDIVLRLLARVGADIWEEQALRLTSELDQGRGFEGLIIGEPDRERRVEISLRLSYDALNDIERRCFRELGVMAPPDAEFSTEAAAAIWRIDTTQTRQLLETLTGAALLDRIEQPGQPSRWRQHRLLRGYALALLRREGEHEAAAARHAAFYAAAMRTADDAQRFYEVLGDYAQLRHAFAWAIENDLELALDLIANTANLQRARDYGRDNLAWAEQALAAAQQRGTPAQIAHARVSLGNALQHAASLPGEDRGARLREALAAYDAALRIYTAETVPLDYAMTQNNR